MDHCPESKGHCDKQHHDFVEPVVRPLTNNDVRAQILAKINGIEFDIRTLFGGVNAQTRHAKYIITLREVLEDYKKTLAAIPCDDEPYVRPDEQ